MDQAETYFLVELAARKKNLQNTTSEPIAAHRWWPLSELSSTAEVVYPDGLRGYLEANGIPFL